MDLEFRITKDGSHTLYHPALDETYHSIHGAVNESIHVFIENGLKHVVNELNLKQVDIYEVGFGTGLNALLSNQYSRYTNININYCASEKYRLDNKVINELNYLSFTNRKLKEEFHNMHRAESNVWTQITDQFQLKINEEDLLLSSPDNNQFHIIYFDAFAPNKQPEMWTPKIFTKMFKVLKPKGALVTYCARGQVKRDLKRAGFNVETLEGPPGKREMIRATKL